MTGGHVVGRGRVLAVAARSHVHGDPRALDKDLQGAGLDIDVVTVDTDTAHTPFGEDIGLGRQGLEHRPIEFFEELPAGHPEPADRCSSLSPLSSSPIAVLSSGRGCRTVGRAGDR